MDHLQLLSPRRLARAFGAFLVGLLVALIAVPAMALTKAQLPLYTVVEDVVFLKMRVYSVVHGCGGSYPSGWDGAEEGYIQDDTVSCGWTAVLRRSKCIEPQFMNTTTYQCDTPPPPDCAQGEIRNPITNLCEKDCSNVAGRVAGTSANHAILSVSDPSSYNGNASFCVEGCAATAQGGVKCYWSDAPSGGDDVVRIGGHCEGQGPFSFNGRNCASYSGGISDIDTVETSPTTPWWDSGKGPNECAKSGGAWGQVNGQNVCIKPGAGQTNVQTSGKDTGTTKSATTPDGSGGTTTKSETTSTECKDGKCTSTTTTTTGGTNANGTPKTDTTETKSETENQTEFCKKNPADPRCTNTNDGKGSWAGGCGGFTCSGDAVQCALAREVHQRNCEATASNSFTDLADAAGAGTDTGAGYIQSEKSTAAISAQSKFNESLQSSPIAATCPASRSIAVPGGFSVDVSFEKACEFAGYLGFFVQAFAYLSAALIVLRNPTA